MALVAFVSSVFLVMRHPNRRPAVPKSYAVHIVSSRTRYTGRALTIFHLRHSIHGMNIVSINQACWVYRQDRGEGCRLYSIRCFENRESVYFIADEVQPIFTAESHQLFQCITSITSPYGQSENHHSFGLKAEYQGDYEDCKEAAL